MLPAAKHVRTAHAQETALVNVIPNAILTAMLLANAKDRQNGPEKAAVDGLFAIRKWSCGIVSYRG
jgi:hypothetical protein